MPLIRRTVTPAALAARRRNAQKSTGPRTPEGKRRSALNARRRTLCSFVLRKVIKFRGEDIDEYLRMHRDLIALLMSGNCYVAARVDELAEALWGKVSALRAPELCPSRQKDIRRAEKRIEDALALLVQSLAHRSRKWWSRLEGCLGGEITSLPHMRARLESRLAAFPNDTLPSVLASLHAVPAAR
ncbi:MAG: hypothetical protein ACE145_03535 [Terriglobia bacterium]